MVGPALRNRSALQETRDGYESRVEDRDGEYDGRNDDDGKKAPGQSGRGREREAGEHQACEERAAVAHEDTGGRVVVDEESHQCPREGERHPRQFDVARQKKIDAHERGGDGANATRQPVHIVQQVESVRDSDEPEQGDHHVDDVIPGQPNADATHEQHRSRRELADQLGAGPQSDEIVDEAEHEDQNRSEEQPVPMGERDNRARRDLPNRQVPGGQKRLQHNGYPESDEDRYSAEIGRWPLVPTLRRRRR